MALLISKEKDKKFNVVTLSVKGLANIFVNYVLQLSFIKLITNSWKATESICICTWKAWHMQKNVILISILWYERLQIKLACYKILNIKHRIHLDMFAQPGSVRLTYRGLYGTDMSKAKKITTSKNVSASFLFMVCFD